eukprot:2547228-Pyramimonas_sp.AAC.1
MIGGPGKANTTIMEGLNFLETAARSRVNAPTGLAGITTNGVASLVSSASPGLAGHPGGGCPSDVGKRSV